MLNSIERRLGNYLLSRQVGRGGFADVYYGEHIYLKTPAAIKVLNVQITGDEHKKFLMEARIAARLEHPHIISVLEFGVENEIPYLVMDYAPHGTLRQRYPKGSRLDVAQIASYVQQIAKALHYIHHQQLIHRDVKPENMLLGVNDDILLSDFGIARVVQNTQRSDNDQRVVGTIAYMAPEQLHGDACPASDQYALGAVIYEWLCGVPPFYGSYAEVAVQHAFVPPVPLRERVTQLPEDVEKVVMIALAKEPQSRFKSMEAFATAFAQACDLSSHSTFVPLAASSLIQSSTSTQSSEETVTLLHTKIQSPAKHLSRRMLTLGLLGGAGLALGAAFAWKPLSQALYPSIRLPSANLAPGTPLYTYHGHHPPGSALLAWSPDSQRIASANDNVQVWYATTGKLERIYRNGLTGLVGISAMAWSPDNKYIAEGMNPGNDANSEPVRAEVHIWETSTGKNIYTYHLSESYQVSALAWSPDSQFVASTGGDSMTIQVWHALTGNLFSTYKGHTSFINSITWSPDGKLIASSDGSTSNPGVGSVHIWEVATGQQRLIYRGHPDAVAVVAWSPDGTRIASAGSSNYYGQKSSSNSNTVQIWKPGSEKPLLIYREHTGPVGSMSWSPDSKLIVSSSGVNTGSNGTASIRVWNASNGHDILLYQGYHLSDVAGYVSWSPDGRYIASSNFDGTVQVWQAP